MTDEDRNKKLLLLKILVIFFTILLLFFWFFNLKNVWKIDKQTAVTSKRQEKSLSELTANFNQTLSKIQTSLNQINKNTASQKAANDEFLVRLAKNIKASSSSENTASTSKSISTSTKIIPITNTVELNSSSSQKLFNLRDGTCPKYINCMPTINSPARSCQIPAGCKNITTLVY